MITIIGTSDRPSWLAEACKILLLLLLQRACTNLHVTVVTMMSYPSPEALSSHDSIDNPSETVQQHHCIHSDASG